MLWFLLVLSVRGSCSGELAFEDVSASLSPKCQALWYPCSLRAESSRSSRAAWACNCLLAHHLCGTLAIPPAMTSMGLVWALVELLPQLFITTWHRKNWEDVALGPGVRHVCPGGLCLPPTEPVIQVRLGPHLQELCKGHPQGFTATCEDVRAPFTWPDPWPHPSRPGWRLNRVAQGGQRGAGCLPRALHPDSST